MLSSVHKPAGRPPLRTCPRLFSIRQYLYSVPILNPHPCFRLSRTPSNVDRHKRFPRSPTITEVSTCNFPTMLCCIDSFGNPQKAYNRQTSDGGVSSFPGQRRFQRTGGNALTAVPPSLPLGGGDIMVSGEFHLCCGGGDIMVSGAFHLCCSNPVGSI